MKFKFLAIILSCICIGQWVAQAADSDNDRLSDEKELELGTDPKHLFIEITHPVFVGIGSRRIGRGCPYQNFIPIRQSTTIGVADQWIGHTPQTS